MERLLTQYVPALLVLGRQVRNCNWAGRAAGGGADVRVFFEEALVVLCSLLGTRAQYDEYVRQCLLQLLMWREWNTWLPGCVYSEEVSEASLAKFVRLLLGHPRAVTEQQAYDLFLLTSETPRTASRDG